MIVDKPAFLTANGVAYAFEEFFIRPSKLIHPDPNIQMQLLNTTLEKQTNWLVLENAMMKLPD